MVTPRSRIKAARAAKAKSESERMRYYAALIHRGGSANLQNMVQNGKLTAYLAAKLSKLPHTNQDKLIRDAERSGNANKHLKAISRNIDAHITGESFRLRRLKSAWMLASDYDRSTFLEWLTEAGQKPARKGKK